MPYTKRKAMTRCIKPVHMRCRYASFPLKSGWRCVFISRGMFTAGLMLHACGGGACRSIFSPQAHGVYFFSIIVVDNRKAIAFSALGICETAILYLLLL